MRLKITHRTEYSFDRPNSFALQRVRLVPESSDAQNVLDWSLEISGANQEVAYTDGFGNETCLLSVGSHQTNVSITAQGRVETTDCSGVTGPHRGHVPLWLFQQETELSRSGPAIAALSREIGPGDTLSRMHALLHLIVDRIEYRKDVTDTMTTAEDAAASGAGVCQDQAHIFISTARLLGVPARYVSGYVCVPENYETASHAWAEAYLDGLGWVAFDPANGISPDDRYVRLAIGRDYRDAAPISGLRLGETGERLEVHVTVEQ